MKKLTVFLMALLTTCLTACSGMAFLTVKGNLNTGIFFGIDTEIDPDYDFSDYDGVETFMVAEWNEDRDYQNEHLMWQLEKKNEYFFQRWFRAKYSQIQYGVVLEGLSEKKPAQELQINKLYLYRFEFGDYVIRYGRSGCFYLNDEYDVVELKNRCELPMNPDTEM